ncbi:RNA polymerase sigma factor [Porticoccus sp. W117]|uniref:RNA polymerase sigma factor n=1 Tax=Porticoccus sp. W117 TaxID=3054777 RepID=UPI0025916574|nr:RNA polymerase sigma factor [Porticoccus sp. W117]MDM3869939.1 RNA polymerase sigma factor [Porticoccus sp. W117]
MRRFHPTTKPMSPRHPTDQKDNVIDILSSGGDGKGDKTAYYSRLYTQHRVWMLRHVKKFGVSEEDAEEIVQEAFVRLLRLDEPDTHSYLRSYLQRIASNIAIDRYRRNQRSPEVPANPEDDSHIGVHQLSPDRIQQSREVLDELQKCLGSLSDKCRTAFTLYKIKGKGYPEIAEAMGVSESMVRKYVLQALRHCYSELKHLL